MASALRVQLLQRSMYLTAEASFSRSSGTMCSAREGSAAMVRSSSEAMSSRVIG